VFTLTSAWLWVSFMFYISVVSSTIYASFFLSFSSTSFLCCSKLISIYFLRSIVICFWFSSFAITSCCYFNYSCNCWSDCYLPSWIFRTSSYSSFSFWFKNPNCIFISNSSLFDNWLVFMWDWICYDEALKFLFISSIFFLAKIVRGRSFTELVDLPRKFRF
jgi:hypothetical protein